MSEKAAWTDLWRGGRLPQFALLLLGVWLNAADTLVTVTVMPSVAREIGGFAYFGWATAVFLLGAITAGASSGVLSARVGLRGAMAWAGLAYAAGCILSALSPTITLFILSRLAQGLGAGWIVGLVFVAVGQVFPASQWARAMAATTSVWGVAILLGPTIGGMFAAAGPHGWRGVFWFFAAQGVVFAVAAAGLLPKGAPRAADTALPWRQLAMLAIGVMALASAGLIRWPLIALGLTIGGLSLLVAMIRTDATAPVALLPRETRNLGSAAGAGYLTILLLECATASWAVYGAAMIQAIYRVDPLIAGYAVGGVAVGWTITALSVSHLKPRWQGPLIRLGAAAIVGGLACIALCMGRGPLIAVAASAALMGAGFGAAWSFMGARIIASLPEAERGLGSGAIPTVQMIGAAVGAAGATALGDVLGLSHGVDRAAALRAGPLLFTAFLPIAAAGLIAAHRLARLAPGLNAGRTVETGPIGSGEGAPPHAHP
jgi:MFS family permease